MLGVSIDTAAYFKQVAEAAAKILVVADKVASVSAEALYLKIIEYTPVGDPTLWSYPASEDYQPGQLKASWQIDYKGSEIDIYNEQPYALRVEYGWSTQAPDGMMRRAVLEFPEFIDKAAERYKI